MIGKSLPVSFPQPPDLSPHDRCDGRSVAAFALRPRVRKPLSMARPISGGGAQAAQAPLFIAPAPPPKSVIFVVRWWSVGSPYPFSRFSFPAGEGKSPELICWMCFLNGCCRALRARIGALSLPAISHCIGWSRPRQVPPGAAALTHPKKIFQAQGLTIANICATMKVRSWSAGALLPARKGVRAAG